jgi:peptidyl-prolyl cis-trans isomerase C
VIRFVLVALLVCTCACKRPADADATQAAARLGLPAAASNDAQAAPPKPVPAALPDVVARVNGESVTKAEFEAAVAAVEQQNGGKVPPEQRDRIYRAVLDQLVGVKLLAQEVTARKVSVPDADVEARIAALRQQFPSEDVFNRALKAQQKTVDGLKADARRDLSISKLLQDALANKVAVTSEQAKKFYDENPDRFKQPERVRASHILIGVPQGADAVTKDAARKRAEDLLKQVKAGKDFAALAKEHSQDPGSAVQGGDLGYFPRGQMVGAFDEAAFSQAPGTISNLVETQFGFHIIKVVEKQAARTVPLEEVKPKLDEFLLNQNRQRETQAFVAGLKAKGKVEILL